MIGNLSNTHIVLALSGTLCLVAVLFSLFINVVYKFKKNKIGHYESGFSNEEGISFCDKKRYLIPFFFIMDIMILCVIVLFLIDIYGILDIIKIPLCLFTILVLTHMLIYYKGLIKSL
ncbi:MAG: hypothetical protein LBI26_00900 [Holosporales bacterium]|jgi:hypothetical protein|nr:hypothetical protein [Holosporales bacterium]